MCRHYWEQIEADKIEPETGNKYIYDLHGMLTSYVDIEQLPCEPPFGKLTFNENQKGARRRRAFIVPWIAQHVVALEGLLGLNAEAQDILRVLVDTGARPSEVIDLPPEHIFLDAPIPHIAIVPEGRVLKTRIPPEWAAVR